MFYRASLFISTFLQDMLEYSGHILLKPVKMFKIQPERRIIRLFNYWRYKIKIVNARYLTFDFVITCSFMSDT